MVKCDGNFFEVVFCLESHWTSLFRLNRDRDVSDPFVKACDPAHQD